MFHVTWGKALTTPVIHDLGVGVKIHNQRNHQDLFPPVPFVSLVTQKFESSHPSSSQHKGEGRTQEKIGDWISLRWCPAKDVSMFWHCLEPS